MKMKMSQQQKSNENGQSSIQEEDKRTGINKQTHSSSVVSLLTWIY